MSLAEELLQGDLDEYSTLFGYRLSSESFFFKLCEAKISNPLDPGMVPGMYLPLSFWRLLLGKPTSTKGGSSASVSRESCGRYFTNEQFTSLVRSGWIGSTIEQSNKLSQIIEKVLSDGRMVIFAKTSLSGAPRDYSRDHFGRFSTEDW
jgi:hypothetical protein